MIIMIIIVINNNRNNKKMMIIITIIITLMIVGKNAQMLNKISIAMFKEFTHKERLVNLATSCVSDVNVSSCEVKDTIVSDPDKKVTQWLNARFSCNPKQNLY